MEFIKSADTKKGDKALLARLKKELKNNQKVLWLVCGGSGIKSEVKILKALRKSLDKELLERLAIMLMDERYGSLGHKDSNWQQLIEAGANFDELYAMPMLHKSGLSLEKTVEFYAKLVKTVFDAADVIVGQFGIGADGHTAGILPGSPAANNVDKLVVGYEAKPFTRITLTHQALKWVDAAYVFAFGKEKKAALSNLKAGKLQFQQAPSMILRDLPEAYVFNDQIGKKS